jgi:hypothetical protein
MAEGAGRSVTLSEVESRMLGARLPDGMRRPAMTPGMADVAVHYLLPELVPERTLSRTPYAAVMDGVLLYLVGGGGSDGRCEYDDVLALHSPALPHSPGSEAYDPSYLKALLVRSSALECIREYTAEESRESCKGSPREPSGPGVHQGVRRSLPAQPRRPLAALPKSEGMAMLVRQMLAYLNRHFAVVRDVPDAVYVRRVSGGRVTLERLTLTAFYRLLTVEGASGTRLSIGRWWYEHEGRHAYEDGSRLPVPLVSAKATPRRHVPHPTQPPVPHPTQPSIPPTQPSIPPTQPSIPPTQPPVPRVSTPARPTPQPVTQPVTQPTPHATAPSNQKASSGEVIVEECLRAIGVAYLRQQPLITIDESNMKGGGLRLDFFLPVVPLAIEVDGDQHLDPSHHRGGLRGFVEGLRCDLLKYVLCRNGGRSLLRLRYADLPNARRIIEDTLARIRATPEPERPLLFDPFHVERQRLYELYRHQV